MDVAFDGVCYAYRRRRPVLHEVSAAVSGPVIALLGPNGAGKSTLLRLLTTEARPSSGHVALADMSLPASPANLSRYRRRLGVVPQQLEILPHLTCEQFLVYVAWLKQVPSAGMDAAIGDALGAVGLGDARRLAVGALSGGMRQRLVLAQAMLADPSVLILDEPTVGLDPEQRVVFREVIRRLAPARLVVLATHLIDDVAALADSVLVLHGGRVLFAGTVHEFAGGEPTSETLERAYLRVVRAEPQR